MNSPENDTPPARRPIWPWIVLLLMTLWAIYAWNRVMDTVDEVLRQIPPGIIELFGDFLRDGQVPERHGRPGDIVYSGTDIRDPGPSARPPQPPVVL